MRLRTIFAFSAIFILVLHPISGFAARKAAPKGGKASAGAKSAGSAPQQKSRRTAFWTCSDGKGTISLFWLPTGGDWPEGGFRLERITRGAVTVLSSKLGPGLDATTLMHLPDAQAVEIRAFSDKLTRQELTEDDQRTAIVKMGGTATIDIPYGLALGVRYIDSARGIGKRSYRLTLIGPDGNAENTVESDEVDPAKRTPGPAQPVGVRAKPLIDSVALFWGDPPVDQQAPVVAYMVGRSIGSGKSAAAVSLTQHPLILERYLRRGQPEFLDDDAPRLNLSYDISGVDLFGRQSAPVRVSVLAKDFPELAPPPDVRVEGNPGSVTIAWTNTDNAYVGGFVIERSPFPNGPFQASTKTPLARDASQYEDKGLESGKEFYYRVRSVSNRGEAGIASPIYLARTTSPGNVAAGTNDGIEEETIVASTLGDDVLPAPTPHRRNPPAQVRRPEPPPAPPVAVPAPVRPPPQAPQPVPVAATPAPRPAPVPPPSTPAPPVPAPVPAPVPQPVAVAPSPAPAPAVVAPAPAVVAPAPVAPAPAPAVVAPAPSVPVPPPAPVAVASAPVPPVSVPVVPPPAAPAAAAQPAADTLPPPVILAIQGGGGKVTISLAPGEPANLTELFLVYRSSSSATMGITVGRPLPGETRQWQDTSAEPGNSYWYRIVAIGAKNRQSEPSRPKWVRVNR